MAEYKIQGETLTAIADAIRAKTGKGSTLTPAQMAEEVNGIQAGKSSVTTSAQTPRHNASTIIKLYSGTLIEEDTTNVD